MHGKFSYQYHTHSSHYFVDLPHFCFIKLWVTIGLFIQRDVWAFMFLEILVEAGWSKATIPLANFSILFEFRVKSFGFNVKFFCRFVQFFCFCHCVFDLLLKLFEITRNAEYNMIVFFLLVELLNSPVDFCFSVSISFTICKFSASVI